MNSWFNVVKGKKVMVFIAFAQLCVGIWQIRVVIWQTEVSQKLSVQADLERFQLRQELAEKATKQEMDALRQDINRRVQRRVPEVLQEMAEQYASRWSADQQESSGVDSQ